MPRLQLKAYFTKSGQQKALDAYAKFATGTAWSVAMKMDLYEWGRQAFSGDGDLAAFTRIYDNLVSHWQVFRPHGTEQCWPPEKIFATVRQELKGFDYSSGTNLMTFEKQKRHA